MKRVIAAAGVLFMMLAGTASAAPGDTRRLSPSRSDALNASVSEDGRYVTFESDSRKLTGGKFSLGDVFRLDTRTHDTVLVSRANGKNGHMADDDASGDASLSADGGFVAFDGSRDLDPAAPDDVTPIYLRDIERGRLLIVSRASGARGRVPNNASYAPVVSRDGLFVAYHSEASNLDPADRNAKPDVYVRDVKHNRTLLVSRASGANGAHSNSISEDPSISADGRFVAFSSRASNLDPDDTDRVRDVFVRDLMTNRTILVSRATNGDKADGESTQPSISADGRFVAFVFRHGNNLDPFDTDRKSDVYLRDLQTDTTTLVSRAAEKANGNADTPSVSADGRRVTFESTATNLDPGDSDRAIDVYVRDLAAGTTQLVSRASGPDGIKAQGADRGYASDATITADGRFVIFESNQTSLASGHDEDNSDVYARELGP